MFGLEHPRPRTSILDRRLNRDLKLLGDLDREIDVSEQFSGEEDDIGFVGFEDFVGLCGFGDEPDRSDLESETLQTGKLKTMIMSSL